VASCDPVAFLWRQCLSLRQDLSAPQSRPTSNDLTTLWFPAALFAPGPSHDARLTAASQWYDSSYDGRFPLQRDFLPARD